MIYVRGDQILGAEDKEIRQRNNGSAGPLIYQEGYTVSYDTFCQLFLHITPWGGGDRSIALAISAFHLLDVNKSHMLSFRGVAWLFGIICGQDFARKLRLFYFLHLAYPPENYEHENIPPTSKPTEVEEEEAVEAEDFFLMTDEVSCPTTSSSTSSAPLERAVSTNSCESEGDDDGLMNILNTKDYKLYEQRFLPPMTQKQFISMWRTVYSFFAQQTEPHIFTALSRVGK